jgi:general secretion pathway protein K
MTGRAAPQHGFALLIVLWSLALIALLATQFIASGRQDAQSARNMMQAAVAEAAADGAVQLAIFHLLDGSAGHWDADAIPHTLALGGSSITVRIAPEDDRVNPNIASAQLLQALLAQLGTDAATAATLADSIVRWRRSGGTPAWLRAETARYRAAGREYAPSGLPFRRVSDLGAVLGMSPALLARVAPHLTVYSDADPTTATHDRVVASALSAASGAMNLGDGGGGSGEAVGTTVSVIADVRGPGGTRCVAHAVVRTDPAVRTRGYRILDVERLFDEPP